MICSLDCLSFVIMQFLNVNLSLNIAHKCSSFTSSLNIWSHYAFSTPSCMLMRQIVNNDVSKVSLIKAMSYDAIFPGTCNATNVALRLKLHYSTPFKQPAMQHVLLQVAEKVELSSTFLIVARQVAACNISSAIYNAIVLESANQSPSTKRLLLRFY